MTKQGCADPSEQKPIDEQAREQTGRRQVRLRIDEQASQD